MTTAQGDGSGQATGAGSEQQLNQVENAMVDWGSSDVHTSSRPGAPETRQSPNVNRNK